MTRKFSEEEVAKIIEMYRAHSTPQNISAMKKNKKKSRHDVDAS